MKLKVSFMGMFIYFSLLGLIFAKAVHAYIDPGTGSFIFQLIVASLLTILLSFRKIGSFFTDIFKKVFSSKKKTSNE